MLQRLAETGLAEYSPHQGVRLTPDGLQLALRIVRRHRLLEIFLSRTLGLGWDEVHAEAEHLEHAASDWLVDRIDAYLGYPERDPHGDPIPDAAAPLRAAAGVPLADCPPGTRLVVLRVPTAPPDFYRYLSASGIAPGGTAEVVGNHAAAGVVTLAADGRQTSLSYAMAEKLLVARLDSPLDAAT